jgi:thioredoxin 1
MRPRPAPPGRGYSASVFEVTDGSFERDVLQADVPVVLDFWAPWCGPCRKVEPILEGLERELGGKVEFARVNVDENPIVASRCGVLSLPTVIVFANGEARETLAGARPRKHYERALASLAGEVLPAAEPVRLTVQEEHDVVPFLAAADDGEPSGVADRRE